MCAEGDHEAYERYLRHEHRGMMQTWLMLIGASGAVILAGIFSVLQRLRIL